jgi:hypothetical protein
MDQALMTTTNATYSLTSNVVRKLTGNAASGEDLTNADYDEIYRRLRKWNERTGKYEVTLYECEQMLKAAYKDAPSRPEISRWERGEIPEPRRRLRNALRAADGRELLPPTIAETMDLHCDPDAPVFFLGDDNGAKAEAVLLIASVSAARITMDGDTTSASIVDVPARTTSRRPCYRPRLAIEIRELVGDDDIEELIRLGKQVKQQTAGWLDAVDEYADDFSGLVIPDDDEVQDATT